MDVNEPILKMNDLKIAFNKQKRNLPVVDGLNLELFRGKVLGMVGESGCGKSMTALSILRLLPSGSNITGEIILENKNLLSLSKSSIRQIRGKKIGMIFQDPNTALNPVRTIGSQFVETLQTHLALMYLGKMVEVLESSTLVGQAVHPYTRFLLSAVPLPDPSKKNIG